MSKKELDNILDKIKSKTMPAGKMNNSYPGVPSGSDDSYVTYRDANMYSSEPINTENTDKEDYGVKTKKGKDLILDQEDPDNEGDESGSVGVGDEKDEKDESELGKIYELKKIYSRLISIESYLTSIEANELVKLKNYLSQGIDLFKTLIYNVDKFTDELNDIIVLYYKFLLEVYDTIKKYFKKEKNQNK